MVGKWRRKKMKPKKTELEKTATWFGIVRAWFEIGVITGIEDHNIRVATFNIYGRDFRKLDNVSYCW